MKIHVWTQDIENCGSPDQPYWKMKGGEDFFIPLQKSVSERGHVVMIMAQNMVDSVRSKIECNSDMFTRTISGWDLVEDDYLTDFERSQLEYDGKIVYPTEIINIA